MCLCLFDARCLWKSYGVFCPIFGLGEMSACPRWKSLAFLCVCSGALGGEAIPPPNVAYLQPSCALLCGLREGCGSRSTCMTLAPPPLRGCTVVRLVLGRRTISARSPRGRGRWCNMGQNSQARRVASRGSLFSAGVASRATRTITTCWSIFATNPSVMWSANTVGRVLSECARSRKERSLRRNRESVPRGNV